MDVPAVVNRFHRIVLSWDYFQLCDRADEGLGVYATSELQAVPNTFESLQVSVSRQEMWTATLVTQPSLRGGCLRYGHAQSCNTAVCKTISSLAYLQHSCLPIWLLMHV